VETAFDVVSRDIEVPDHRNWVEPSTGTQPHLSFFDVSDEEGGMAVISHGLTEYEVKDNESRTMVLTLIKGIRYPKVGLPPERVERLDQIGSQCLGKHTFSYALFPHEGNWETGKVIENSYKHFTSIKLIQCGITKGELAKSNQFFKIEPEELVLSALKKCDSRDSVILRFFNPTENELDGEITFLQPIKGAWFTNLNEERLDEIPVDSNGTLILKVGHKKIITLELKL
jgi:mannosylglycerate hydrolase